jgi:hypothetical protein
LAVRQSFIYEGGSETDSADFTDSADNYKIFGGTTELRGSDPTVVAVNQRSFRSSPPNPLNPPNPF